MIELRPVGYYDRQGQSQCGEPSLRESISETPQPDEEKIVRYLESGLGIWGCGGVEKDIINPTAGGYLDLDIYTDGVWKWRSYLAYYVRKYHVRLPDAFVDHLRANKWLVPSGLDWKDYVSSPNE